MHGSTAPVAAANDHTASGDPTGEHDPVRACVARILNGSDLPALSRQIIDTISALDNDATSLQRLANVVLREYSLTVSVVRTANSAHYRRSGRPVQSATHAMMLIGAGTVRQLASGLLLFENFSRRSDGLRELMLLSLLTANHAREIAVALGEVDPGEAHLCGMFRNIGEVLVAGHLPEVYARIHAHVRLEGRGEQRACSAELGFQYEDLGVEICRQWGMPEAVVHGVRARAGHAHSRGAAVTAFSHDLTTALYRRGSATDVNTDLQVEVDAVLSRHAGRIRLTREQVRRVAESALAETREMFLAARVSIDALRLRELAEAASDGLGVSAVLGETWSSDASASVPDAIVPIEPEAIAPLRTRLLQELEASVDVASGAEVSQILLLALETLLRGAPFDRVVAGVLDADRGRLKARVGLGDDVEGFMRSFDFAMTGRIGPVAAAMQRADTAWLPLDRPLNLMELRWTLGVGVAQFGVFPLVVDGTAIGCLYADRQGVTPEMDRSTRTFVEATVALVSQAISARRRARAAPVSVPLETKAALVLRALRGESLESLAREAGVERTQLERWREQFLAGALDRLATGTERVSDA